MDIWLNTRKLVKMLQRPVSPCPYFFRDWCLPRHGKGQDSSIDSSPDVTRTFNEKNNIPSVFSSRSQLIEIEESHRGSATRDSSRNEFQPQAFQHQDRQNPFDQQQRTGELKGSPCMSKLVHLTNCKLMMLEQGQSISREVQLRPRNSFVANRLPIAVGPDSLSLGNQAYLDSTQGQQQQTIRGPED